MALSIRNRQAEALLRMLNNNKEDQVADVRRDRIGEDTAVWKVLVYDQRCGDILAPVLSVGKLREHCVTLHLLLHAKREPIREAPAVYFSHPTRESILLIGKDFEADLYGTYSLNFATPIGEEEMQLLGEVAAKAGVVPQVSQVFDQHLNFVSLEDKLFDLRLKQSYQLLHSPKTSDMVMMDLIHSIVDALFNVLVTLGSVPVIRCPPSGPSGMIGQQLDEKLRKHLISRGRLFSRGVGLDGSLHRPVLILVDRETDLSVLLHHTWTYGALIHDLLGMDLNRVTVQPGEEEDAPRRTKAFGLDQSDSFWQEFMGQPFPQVAEAVDERVTRYRARVDELGVAEDDGGDDGEKAPLLGKEEDASALVGVVKSLPELQQEKHVIDIHTNVATALLEHIRDRELDSYFAMEDAMMMQQGKQDKFQVLSLLTGGKGTPEDKLRLLLIYYLTTLKSSEEEQDTLAQFRAAVEKEGMDLRALDYVARSGSFSLSKPVGRATGSEARTKRVITGLKFLTGKVRNLLPAQKDLPVTRLVDSVMDAREHTMLFLDPKLMNANAGGVASATAAQSHGPFQDAIVFVVGGGNYVEYQNLHDYAGRTSSATAKKRILYGSTDIVSPSGFLEQLSSLRE